MRSERDLLLHSCVLRLQDASNFSAASPSHRVMWEGGALAAAHTS